MAIWQLIVTLSAIGTLARYIGELPYLVPYLELGLDISSHFLVVWTLGSLFGVLFFVAIGRPLWLVISLVTLLANGVELAPFFLPKETVAPKDAVQLRLVGVDLWDHLPDQGPVQEILATHAPEIAVFTGVTGKWAELLSRMRGTYPHHLAAPLEDRPGLAVYSSIPLSDSAVHYFHSRSGPTISARITVEGTPLLLVATQHPFPLTDEQLKQRTTHLAKLAKFIREFPEKTILTGQLGTAPWSYYYHTILERTELIPARFGQGLRPTWPILGTTGLLPHFHLLASPALPIADIVTGDAAGLRAKPLVADISIPTK